MNRSGPGFGRRKPPQSDIPKPKSLREIPKYLGKVIGSFFSHLFFIVRLVWETNPWILIAMLLLCLTSGVLPVWGAYLSADLITQMSGMLASPESYTAATFITTAFFAILLTYFIYQFIQRVLNRISGMLNSLAGCPRSCAG